MNPLLARFLGSFFRWALAGVAGWLVNKGILTPGDSTDMLAGVVMGLVALAWALWQKYGAQLWLHTGLTLPAGSTLNDIKASITRGEQPSAFTPSDEAPRIVTMILLGVIALGSLATLAACAGNLPPAQLALTRSQDSRKPLDLAQDTEARLCWGMDAITASKVVEDLRHCTSATAAAIGLTDERHGRLHLAFAKAYQAHITMSQELKLWTSGPAPTSVATFVQQAKQALEVAKLLAPGDARVSALVDQAQAIADAADKIAAAFTH
jgi:hypothetical protein